MKTYIKKASKPKTKDKKLILNNKKTLTIKIISEDQNASFLLIELITRGLAFVLFIKESSLISNIWLNPFAEKVKKLPPIIKKIKSKKEKLPSGKIKPIEAEKATVKDKRNLNKEI